MRLDQLYVDRAYQRDLSERSVTLIRQIVAGFDWARARPAVGVRHEDGRVELLDGQHLATAAASHGGVTEIPVLVVSDRTQAEKADAFVSLNRDRVAMTPLSVFRAALVAGDPVAVAVADGLERAGARMLMRPPPQGRYEIGDTVAVGAMRDVAKAKGPVGLARLAGIAVTARRAPITTMLVRALALCLWSREYAGDVKDDAYAAALLASSQIELESDARANARARKIPAYAALAMDLWRRASDV
ncbi:hypothetical protein OA2633_00110 [Oceanicaulis sp. HTCC2633]|nr:hypothetical protein OA2633_00110 [Oceanicaulis sp. HTCC2633]